MNINNNFSFVFVLALIVICESGLCLTLAEEKGFETMKTSNLLGGLRDYKGNENNGEIESIGRFAVQEHNKKENAILEFARVIKAKEQVVSGKMYHLTLEAIDAGKKKIYEAKVWVKPWMNFKQLQEFRYTTDTPSFATADLAVKQGY